jgi:hypothetical protein
VNMTMLEGLAVALANIDDFVPSSRPRRLASRENRPHGPCLRFVHGAVKCWPITAGENAGGIRGSPAFRPRGICLNVTASSRTAYYKLVINGRPGLWNFADAPATPDQPEQDKIVSRYKVMAQIKTDLLDILSKPGASQSSSPMSSTPRSGPRHRLPA